MKLKLDIDTEQHLSGLLSPTEAAESKGMSLQLFKYYLRTSGSPKPIHIGKSRKVYFWPAEIAVWNPKQPKQEG